MTNKLTKEQEKRFDEKFRTGAENNLEMYDDSLGANCFSNAGIAPLARYLADEIARAREEGIEEFNDYLDLFMTSYGTIDRTKLLFLFNKYQTKELKNEPTE